MLFLNIVLKVLATAIKQEKFPYKLEKEKIVIIRKWHTVFVENPKEYPKQLQELIGEFIKFSEYMLKI